jgi:hypothetical protein
VSVVHTGNEGKPMKTKKIHYKIIQDMTHTVCGLDLDHHTKLMGIIFITRNQFQNHLELPCSTKEETFARYPSSCKTCIKILYNQFGHL